MAESNPSENYVIIDTDCGVDDALAIIMAADCHKKGLIKILAITCVFGNTSVDNVVKNVCHTIDVCDIFEKIKIFKGCKNSLLNKEDIEDIGKYFFGNDGLGDSTSELRPIDYDIEPEHAINALSKLAKQYPKQITIMALGPLTNLALTHMMDNTFFGNLKELVVMGGTVSAYGNTGPNHEFNFCSDPEAVDVILTNRSSPLTIIPWDPCLNHFITWEVYDKIVELNSTKSVFFEKINRRSHKITHSSDYLGTKIPGLTIADILVVVVFVFPQLIYEHNEYPTRIELKGELTRGQLVVDRRQKDETRLLKARKVKFITQFKQSLLMDLILEILK